MATAVAHQIYLDDIREFSSNVIGARDASTSGARPPLPSGWLLKAMRLPLTGVDGC